MTWRPSHRRASRTAPIPRRTLLVSALAGAAACGLPRVTSAAMPLVSASGGADQRFSILRAGDKIGVHAVSHSTVTDETRVTTEIDLVVKVIFFTAYAFHHRSEEIWRDGRLASLRSETVEDGETLHVMGTATPRGFEVAGKDGPFIAAPGALTSNDLWMPAVLEQATVIDAQHGGVIGVSMRKLADEQIDVAGHRARTARYRLITPYLAGSIWYDETGRWVHGEFEHDADQIVYRLDA